MLNLYDRIEKNDIVKLTKLLKPSNLFYKKNASIPLFDKKNIIYIESGYIQLIKYDFNGNMALVEEYYEGMTIIINMYVGNNNFYELITKEDTNIKVYDYDLIMNSKHSNYFYIQFIKNILKITSDIAEEQNSHIEILSRKNIREKLLKYFDIMFKKNNSNIIYLPFSYADLANYLSIDRCAMTRELKYLKEDGFISSKGRKIYLLYKEHFTNNNYNN